MRKTLRDKITGTKMEIEENSISILIQSSKLNTKVQEEITMLIIETLSNTLGIKLQMERKDLRVTSDLNQGVRISSQILFSFSDIPSKS